MPGSLLHPWFITSLTQKVKETKTKKKKNIFQREKKSEAVENSIIPSVFIESGN